MTAPKGAKKPKKPYKDFPLTPHDSGQWVKRVRGRLYRFGPWADPDAALERWLREKDDLLAGRAPLRPGSTVGDLCNAFLAHKAQRRDLGEIVPPTFRNYENACKAVAGCFGASRQLDGLSPADFERLRARLAVGKGPRSLVLFIRCVRILFRYAHESGLIEAPVRFGPSFRPPTAATIRKDRASKPPRLFGVKELRKVISAATGTLKAMLLLGINAGFNNADCGRLNLDQLDLDGGWHNFPRPKNGMPRRAKLWPETIVALNDVLFERPNVPKADRRVFVPPPGAPGYNGNNDQIGKLFRQHLARIGAARPGLTFIALRHTFLTVAEGSLDFPAVDYMMGHHDPRTARHYRERIDDDRLKAVADYVRTWLWGK